MTETQFRAEGKPSVPGWYWFRQYRPFKSIEEWIIVHVYDREEFDLASGVRTHTLMGWIAGQGTQEPITVDTWPEGDWAGPLTPPPLAQRSCPYCGGRRLKRISEGGRHYLECQDCGGRGPGTREKTLAVVSWDHRTREAIE